jgi:regulator of replication initiation timing
MSKDHELEELLRALMLALIGAQRGTDGLEELVDWDALKTLVLHVQDLAEERQVRMWDDSKELEMQRRERDRLEAELETVRKRLTEPEAAIEEQGQEAMQQMSQEAMRQMSNAASGFGNVTTAYDAAFAKKFHDAFGEVTPCPDA